LKLGIVAGSISHAVMQFAKTTLLAASL